MSELRSCPECRRHVREQDDECPFCHTKKSLRGVAVVAAAAISVVAAAACGDKTPPNVPGGAPSADTSSVPSATPSAVPSVKRGDQAPAPVYGGPPP